LNKCTGGVYPLPGAINEKQKRRRLRWNKKEDKKQENKESP
jgi:hypothetical protein